MRRQNVFAVIAGMVLFMTPVIAQPGRGQKCSEVLYFYPWMAATSANAWQKGSSLTLYIVSPSSGGFAPGQITDIETALSNWSTTARTNLSITNSVVTTAPTSFPSQYILVQFGDTSACGAGQNACTNYNYSTATSYPTYSVINISTSVGTTGIRPLMAHEIGHTYIIADCTDSAPACDSTLTVMNPSVTGSSATSPLCCDLDLIYAVTQTGQGALCSN